MKLFTRYSRINVAAMSIIFVVASIAFYLILNYIILRQIDHDLEIEEGEVTTYVSKYGRLPEMISVKDQLIGFSPSRAPVDRHFETVSRPAGKGSSNKVRQLAFGVQAGKATYRVTVSKSLDEANRFMNAVWLVLLTTIITLLLVTLFINRVILKRLWTPFYRSLDIIRKFRLGSNDRLKFEPTATDEFNLMNDILEKMITRAHNDYLSLKTFSENASHEIQTPLSIISTKLDLIVQGENLNEKQIAALKDIYSAVERLSSLNRSLLLLVKIENKQFETTEYINVADLLNQKIREFDELWTMEELKVKVAIKPVFVTMNEGLLNILLNNLLANATQHNFRSGEIDIVLNSAYLQVCNTSHMPAIPLEGLFKRFYSSKTGSGGSGLGLSIVQQIAASSGLPITYEYGAGKHKFSIHWPV